MFAVDRVGRLSNATVPSAVVSVLLKVGLFVSKDIPSNELSAVFKLSNKDVY